MTQENKIADNTEGATKFGRRSTDNTGSKGDISQSKGDKLRSVFNGLGLAFILTVCVTTGRLLGQMDSNVKGIDDNKVAIKETLVVVRDLVVALNKSNVLQEQRDIQQKESDKRFEEKFDDANDKLDRINDGVQKNRESIIILQNSGGKLSLKDKTKVDFIAMR